MVCDWDKQIFKYSEDDQEWVTCVYHGKARVLDQILVGDEVSVGVKEANP